MEIDSVSQRGSVAYVQVLTEPHTARRQRECVFFLVLESIHLLPPRRKEVCTNHGYSSMDVSDDAWMTFDEVKSEVDAQRPFVISMWSGGTPIGGESAYGDHSVACVGYHDYTEDWVSIHDTWDTQIHNIVYGNWLGAMATWVRP